MGVLSPIQPLVSSCCFVFLFFVLKNKQTNKKPDYLIVRMPGIILGKPWKLFPSQRTCHTPDNPQQGHVKQCTSHRCPWKSIDYTNLLSFIYTKLPFLLSSITTPPILGVMSDGWVSVDVSIKANGTSEPTFHKSHQHNVPHVGRHGHSSSLQC